MKVQIKFADFDTGISANGLTFTSFTHGVSKMLKECWLIDDLFMIVGEQGNKVYMPLSACRGFSTLLDIDFLKDEHEMSVDEQKKICRARAAAQAPRGDKK